MAVFHQRTFGQPSQDTIFMRGFHIRQDVDDIRDYFYDEGRCSVVFFKENQHFQKLFIALKFESISTAKKVMKKYNDAEVMGDWIQLTWFKKPTYSDRRDDDYRNDDRRRKRYESRSRSRSNGRAGSTPPRRKRTNHNSRISIHHNSDSEEDYKKLKDGPKRIPRRKVSSSSEDGSNSVSIDQPTKILSPYKEQKSIWDKPDMKIEPISHEPMKIDIKKSIPIAVPAPINTNSNALATQINISNSSISSSLMRSNKNTSKDSINTPISSPDYSSDSEPSPPVKLIKKKIIKKKVEKFEEDEEVENEDDEEVDDIEEPQLNPLKSVKVKPVKILTSFMQNSTATLSADLRKKVSHLSNENVNLVKRKKEDIEKSYRQDCETFSMVVKMLVGKDQSLEEILQDSLKENLKSIGQRCIHELRDFIEQLRNDSIHDIF